MERKIDRAIAICGYTPRDRGLFCEALQLGGSSIQIINGRLLSKGNKQIAHVGDAALYLLLRSAARRRGDTTRESATTRSTGAIH